MREYQEFLAQQQYAKWIRIGVFGVTIVVMGVCLVLVTRALLLPTPEATSATTPPAVAAPATFTAAPEPISTAAPMATNAPPPTATSIPSEPLSSTVAPTGTSPSGSSFAWLSDPQGDVGAYESGASVGGIPGGVDIQTANVGADLRVALQPGEGVPVELVEWAGEGDMLLWISLYDPVPASPAAFTDWVFVLDVDGNVATGRPAGTVRINPDLGYEVAIGVSYNDASGEYEPYFLVWDPAQATLVLKSDVPRFTLNEARTLIGLALPMQILTQSVEQTAGVTLVAESVKGRVAAQSYVGEQKIVDFCPDRPN